MKPKTGLCAATNSWRKGTSAERKLVMRLYVTYVLAAQANLYFRWVDFMENGLIKESEKMQIFLGNVVRLN